MRVAHMLGFDVPEWMAAEAERMRDTYGITVFKVKVGRRPARLDIDVCRKLREVLGDGAELYIDGNRGWTASESAAALRELGGLGITLAEELLVWRVGARLDEHRSLACGGGGRDRAAVGGEFEEGFHARGDRCVDLDLVAGGEGGDAVVRVSGVWCPEPVDADDAVGDRLDQRVGECPARAVPIGGVGLEVGGHHDHRHVEGCGVSHLHAHPVVDAGAMEDGDHSAEGLEAFAVQFEEPAAFDGVDEVFLSLRSFERDRERRTWLAQTLAPARIEHSLSGLEQAQPTADTETEPLRRALAECDRKLARHCAALEAGADPALVAAWSRGAKPSGSRTPPNWRRPRTGGEPARG